MSEEIKEFNINLEDIKESNNLFDNLHEAIEKMRLHTLSDRFEVVLNNNLIESKEKLTNFRTILGCRISYDNLDKNISFIVREDDKPSYEQLEKENILLKEANNYHQEIINSMKEPENAHYYHLENIKLRTINNQLENIRKEAIEYINKMWLAKLTPGTVSDTKFDLLNILSKGDNK